MNTKLSFVLGALLAGPLGFAAAKRAAPPDQEQLVAAVKEQRRALDGLMVRLNARLALPVSPSGEVVLDVALLRGEIARALREELRRGGPASEQPTGEGVTAAPSPASAEALQKGLRLVDQAISSRQWRETDAEQLREILSRTGEAHRGELLAKLLPALNSGQISVETAGPPF